MPLSKEPPPDQDPFDGIPSLRSVVERFPHMRFQVLSYVSKTGIGVYFLLVRSLPVGLGSVGEERILDGQATVRRCPGTYIAFRCHSDHSFT